MKNRKTRFPELNYAYFGRGHWQIVDAEDNAQIGPFYHSREELLGDLERFAAVFGCKGDAP